MDREDKIRFLSHRLKGRTTQSHLESKPDQYINALFIIEGNVFVNESKKKLTTIGVEVSKLQKYIY